MQLGGNAKFRDFLDKYQIKNMNIHKKYKTKAAKHYREYLDSLCNGSSPGKPPKIDDGKEPFEIRNNNFKIQITGFGSDDMYPPKPRKRSKSKFKESWQKGKKKMEEWGTNISKRFGKMFRRSKSKRKKKQRKSSNEPNDDISESNDSYFEIDAMKRGRKAKNQKRFDDKLISFKKNDNKVIGKPFPGWKKYSENPEKNKRKFNSQTSEDTMNNINIKQIMKKKSFSKSLSDNEGCVKILGQHRIKEKENFKNEKSRDIQKNKLSLGVNGNEYQDPFGKGK